MLVSWRRVLQTALANWFSKDTNLRRLLNCAKLVLTSLCCCVSRCDVTSRAVFFCLTSPKDSSDSWGDELCLKGVCTFLSVPLRFIVLDYGKMQVADRLPRLTHLFWIGGQILGTNPDAHACMDRMDFMREQFNYILNVGKTLEVQNSSSYIYKYLENQNPQKS